MSPQFLEEARTAKEVSNRPSEVQVVIGWLNSLASHPNPIFERYQNVLPELLGVPQVHLADAIVTEGTVEKGAFYVQAKPAARPQVRTLLALHRRRRQRQRYPTVCLRCADALEAINFAPYTPPPSNPTEPQA